MLVEKKTMVQNKTPTEATLLRWRRDILTGTASSKVNMKLIDYVEKVSKETGFLPVMLMAAYYKAKYSADGGIRQHNRRSS